MPTYIKYDLAAPVNKLLKIESMVQDSSKLTSIMKRYGSFAVDESLFSYIEEKIPPATGTIPGIIKTDGTTTDLSADGAVSILTENPFKTYVVSDVSVSPTLDKVVIGADTKISFAANSLLFVPSEIRYFVISSSKLGLENVVVEAVANNGEYTFATPSDVPLSTEVTLQLYAVDAYGNKSRQLNLTFTTTKPYISTPTILSPTSRAIINASANVAFSATPFETVPSTNIKLETAVWKIYGAHGTPAWTAMSNTPYIIGPKASDMSDYDLGIDGSYTLGVEEGMSVLLVATVFYIGNNISRPASVASAGCIFQYDMRK